MIAHCFPSTAVVLKHDCRGRPWVSKGRHGPFPVALHAASRRQGTGLDPGAVPRGAGARWLRGRVLLSRPRSAGARCRRQCAAGGDRDADRALSRPIRRSASSSPPRSTATSEILKIDGEGRVVLTEPLKTHAGDHGRGHVCRVLVTNFKSGSRAAFARNSRRPPRRSARCKKQLGSRVAAEDPHGARE